MFSAKLRQVYFKLIPYLDNPNEFKFLSESTKRSLANYELTLPVPKYLQGSIPDLNNPDE